MALFAILAAGILTMWVPGRWALSGFQIALLALGVARLVRRGAGWDPGGALLAAVAAWGAVQWVAGWTVDPFRTQEEALHWTVCAVAFALAQDLLPEARARFLTALVALGAVLSIVAMLTVFSSPTGVAFWSFDVGTTAATLGPFVYRNQWAAFVEVVLPVALWRAVTDRDRAWAYAAAAGLLFASVVAAGSRTGAALCLAEVLLVPLLAAHSSGRALGRTVLVVAGAVGVLTLVAGWQELWARFQEPNPYGLRRELLLSSWEMFRARPWTGFGLGTWSAVYPGYARFDDGTFVNQAHSDWAQWAAEGGIPLFVCMLAFVARLLRPALRGGWSVGLMALFVHAAVDYPFQQRPALAVFWFVISGLVCSRNFNADS